MLQKKKKNDKERSSQERRWMRLDQVTRHAAQSSFTGLSCGALQDWLNTDQFISSLRLMWTQVEQQVWILLYSQQMQVEYEALTKENRKCDWKHYTSFFRVWRCLWVRYASIFVCIEQTRWNRSDWKRTKFKFWSNRCVINRWNRGNVFDQKPSHDLTICELWGNILHLSNIHLNVDFHLYNLYSRHIFYYQRAITFCHIWKFHSWWKVCTRDVGWLMFLTVLWN